MGARVAGGLQSGWRKELTMRNGVSWRKMVLLVAILVFSIVQAGAGQTVATRKLMRQKLTYAQQLLEALTTSDFAMLERSASELAKIPTMPGWMVLHLPEYRRYSEAFLRATVDLSTSAKLRDLDESAMHFQSLTMSCYQCHRYLKNSRLAK
jgi:hypothetical protein